MKRLLITGGNGFIGHNLIDYIEKINQYEKTFEVVAPSRKECDVTKTKDLSKFLSKSIDHVIHLAAMTSVQDAWNIPGEAIKQNIDGTINVVDFCRQTGSKLTMISAYVYGVQYKQPISEMTDLHSNNPYSLSKIASEEICKFYSENFDVDITVLRPFNVYGPGLKQNFLLPTIVKQLLNDSESVTVNSLSTKRDYIYVDDLVDVIILSLEKTEGFNIFNVGYGESYSTKELIARIKRLLNVDKKVVSREIYRKNEIPDTVADISLIKKKWRWSPKIDFETGLKMYLDEYMRNM